MWETILPYILSLVFGLVSAFLMFLCRKFYKQSQDIKKLQEKEKRENTRLMIQEELVPVVKELAEMHSQMVGLEHKIEDCTRKELQDIAAIRLSYRFRLVQLCNAYLRQGYITLEQYNQLSEFFRVYRSIGGNGQAEEIYNKAIALEIRNDEDDE